MESTPTEIGPMPPSIGGKVDNPDESELRASIKKKGANSYYYAHNYEGQNFNNENAKKFYGDGLIYGGEPTLVSTGESSARKAPEKQISKIAKYSFLDEDSKVKIYIDLDQFKSQITKEMVDIQFKEYEIQIRIVEESGNENVLSLKPLYEKIEPEKCQWRHTEKKITITLRKWLETKWSTLTKAK